MVRIEKERYVDGNYNAVLDLQVSTTAELPDMGDTIGLYTVAPGSIAQIVQADEPTFLTLDEDGTWYPEQSDSSESNALNASLSAPKNLGGEREEIVEEPVETEKSVLYPDEVVKEQKKAFEESIEEPEKDGEDDDELL